MIRYLFKSFKGENGFEPRPQNEIMVHFRVSFKIYNDRRPTSLLYGVLPSPPSPPPGRFGYENLSNFGRKSFVFTLDTAANIWFHIHVNANKPRCLSGGRQFS